MARSKKIAYIAVSIIVILATSSLLFMLNSTQILRAIGVTKPAPIFTFSESKAPGWWAAQNYNSQEAMSTEEAYEGSEPIEKLSVASMNIFKGKKGDMATACFAMLSYYDYKADVAQLKKDKDSAVLASEFMKNIGEDTLSIDALGATKNFTLTNYELIGPGAENSMKGMSYGWVDLGDGHISSSVVCPTADELNDSFAAIGAMSLVKQ